MESSRKQNNRLVRARNIKKLLLLIKEFEPISLEQLIRKSSLSYPTVFGIVKDLERDLYVEQSAFAPTTGGRQAVLYSLSGLSRYVAALHLEETQVNIVITNLRGGKIFQGHSKTPAKKEELTTVLLDLVHSSLETTGLAPQALVHLCLIANNSSKIELSPIGRYLENKLAISVIATYTSDVLNYLERQSSHISSLKTYLFVLYDHSFYLRSYRGAADPNQSGRRISLSHVTVYPDGLLGSCGLRGCLHTYVSGEGLISWYKEAGGTQQLIAGNQVFHTLLRRSYQGDQAAQVAIEHALEALAIALANIIKVEGITTVVLAHFFQHTDLQLKVLLENLLSLWTGQSVHLIIGTSTIEDSPYAACLMTVNRYFEELSFL